MTTHENRSLTGMVTARRQESVRKQASTAATINKLLLDGTLISITSVAHLAGVSRNFIYSHESLLHQLEAARQTQLDACVPRQRPPSHGAPGQAALNTELALAHQTIKRLRQELTELTNRHRACLGKQAETTAESENHATATTASENSRLIEENHLLHGQVDTLGHRIRDLLDDLTAERRSNTALMIQQ